MGIIVLILLMLSIGVVIFGYFQAKKNDTILLDDGFINPQNKPFVITDPYKGMRDDIKNVVFHSDILSPKEYGIRFGNGASRIKKTNRLKFIR